MVDHNTGEKIAVLYRRSLQGEAACDEDAAPPIPQAVVGGSDQPDLVLMPEAPPALEEALSPRSTCSRTRGGWENVGIFPIQMNENGFFENIRQTRESSR